MEMLGEDIGLRRELLPIFLCSRHVKAEAERVLEQVAPYGGALRHEWESDCHDDADDHDGPADQPPAQLQPEEDRGNDACGQQAHAHAPPGRAPLLRTAAETIHWH